MRYDGAFVHGKKSGHGTISYPDSSRYAGEFRDDLYDGAGRYVAADGSTYEGRFRAGDFHGRGIHVFAGGDTYSGEFRNNLMDGQAVYRRRNGETYTGQFQGNRRSGTGTYAWPDGSTYTGQFEDNEISGEGTYTHADGTKYVGHFRNGRKHGWGTLIAPGGERRQRWENGQKLAEERAPVTVSPLSPPRRAAAGYRNQARAGRKLNGEPHGSGTIRPAAGRGIRYSGRAAAWRVTPNHRDSPPRHGHSPAAAFVGEMRASRPGGNGIRVHFVQHRGSDSGPGMAGINPAPANRLAAGLTTGLLTVETAA
ncbi:MAG: hypothetical protein MZV65_30985 [Chromatiales bacterium]|nr:hypothetical protein [Chromatiales bacterium]